ncbi:MAG: AI-2E family transporter [Chloroflexi bacterium]|nr:AI-2E family transporter [Chloroflexota bacterium]
MAFSDIIMLFFLAWLVAFALKPLTNWLVTRYSFPRPLAAGAVYSGLLLLLIVAGIVIVPIITFQLAQLGSSLPLIVEELPGLTGAVQQDLQERGLDIQLYQWYQNQDIPAQIQKLGTLAIQNTLTVVTGVASALFSTLLVLILSFYIMLDGEALTERLIRLAPPQYQVEVRYLFASIDRSFGGFLRGQLIQAVVYAVGTGLIMWMAGLNYVLLASTFSGIIMIVPFFGPFLGLVPPLSIAIFQASSISQLIVVLIALLVLQQIVLNVLAPKIMSDALGMHPLLVFLAILVGAKTAGLAGAIFGVPIVAVINAMVLYFIRRSTAYSTGVEGRGSYSPARRDTQWTRWLERASELRAAITRLMPRSG